VTKTLSWFGTGASILGSFAVAGHLFVVGYVAFLLGCFALLGVFLRDRNWSMIVLQGFFMVANVIGLYNAF